MSDTRTIPVVTAKAAAFPTNGTSIRDRGENIELNLDARITTITLQTYRVRCIKTVTFANNRSYYYLESQGEEVLKILAKRGAVEARRKVGIRVNKDIPRQHLPNSKDEEDYIHTIANILWLLYFIIRVDSQRLAQRSDL
jgi:hypothetical protein